jgi:hypothetical protein
MGSGALEERERGWEVNVFIRYSNQHVVVLEHNRSSEERKKDNDNETEGVSQSQHLRSLIPPMVMMSIIPHLSCAVQTQASSNTPSCIQ